MWLVSVINKIDRKFRTSLVVQWLGLHAPSAGDPGSIPGQGTRSHRPQLKSLYAASKDLVQISKEIFFFNFKK